MKRLLRVAARLYPRAWRDRYGREFDALIDDLTPRWRNVFNIVAGALIMQMSRLTVLPVALAVGGAVAGAAVSLALPPVYASTSQVLVQVPSANGNRDDRSQRIRTHVEAALQESAFDKQRIAVTMRSEPGADPVMVEVSASGESALEAKRLAENAVGRFVEANLAAGSQTRNLDVQFRVVEAPRLPVAQRGTTRNSAVGGGLGLVVGAAVVVLGHRRRRPTA